MNIRWVLACFLLVLSSFAQDASACIHAMGLSQPELPTTGLEAIVLHDGSVEHLYWKVGIEANESSDLTWVLPVPNAPTSYAVASSSLFQQVGEFVGLSVAPKARSKSAAKRKALDVIESPVVEAGPYQFQSLMVQGEEGAAALNEWLVLKGFAPVDPARLAYYVERNWTFVTVRVRPKEGRKFKAGPLPPVHLTFETHVPVIPFKLMASDTAARVYFISSERQEESVFSEMKKKGFELALDPRKGPKWRSASSEFRVNRMTFYSANAPISLKSAFEDVYESAKMGHIYTLLSADLSEAGNWKEDLYIGPPGTRLEYEKKETVEAPDLAEDAAEAPNVADSAPDSAADEAPLEEFAASSDVDELQITLIAAALAALLFIIAFIGMRVRR